MFEHIFSCLLVPACSGYMPPEYAMDGVFSEKSDVFSFGVILLEMVSGKKNIAFYESDHSMNLLSSVSKIPSIKTHHHHHIYSIAFNLYQR